MKNISRLTCSAIISCVAVVILNQSSFAGTVTTSTDVALSCSRDSRHPTAFIRRGRPDTQLSATMKGIKIDGREPLIMRGIEHYKPPIDMPSKEERAILRTLNISVSAKCNNQKPIYFWPGGTTLACNKGDTLIVELYRPECTKSPDQHGVFTLMETRDVEDVINTTAAPEEAGYGFELISQVPQPYYTAGKAEGSY